MKKYLFFIFIVGILFLPKFAFAQKATSTPAGLQMQQTDAELKTLDTDGDGLTDFEEINIYKTNPQQGDSDGDGFSDGEEVKNVFDPNKFGEDRLEKLIYVDLKTQTLTYFLGPYQVREILVSSGTKSRPTPAGEYSILKKLPSVHYKGTNYDYPNTRWNMLFKYQKGGNLYIHGAYWHNNFGKVMSHGCVNVSYADVEALYNWADLGTKIVIQ